MSTRHLLGQTEAELKSWFERVGQPTFRAMQVLRWAFQQRATSFRDMTDLPVKLRHRLESEFHLWSMQVSQHQKSDDGTEKLLLTLEDNANVECVLLRDGSRRTVCISTQVGCAMGCVFCASGLEGVDRNLTSGQIIEQMLLLQRLLPPDERLSHIVVMGMGEPLANLAHLLPALEMASRADGLGISVRRITISTVGLPKSIDQLARESRKYHLAVSLHAPNDQLRNELVPVNKNIGLESILRSADHYFETSGRRLTYEYVLLRDINDHVQHAQELGKLLAGRNVLLNVIPYNPVAGLPFRAPEPSRIRRFREVLESAKITVKFRQRKGNKIDAACGQLRRLALRPETRHQIVPG